MTRQKAKINMFSIRRIVKATGYAFAGLRTCYINEAAFRQEVWAAIFLIPTGFWLGEGTLEKLMLVGSVFLVLIVELFNSAIEATIDRISHDHHPLSKAAKDIASAAVCLSLILWGIVWAMILF